MSKAAAPTRRYAAKVEKGENAWRREWSGFMSGVNLKELRRGGSVVLPKSADLELNENNNNNNNNNNEEESCQGGRNFSYLFASPTERKAERLAKQRAEDEKRKKLKQQQKKDNNNDPLSHLSKHERALLEAQQRGLQVEGMTRKEVRNFLHLTISKEQQEAAKHQEEFRPHELMDEKLQWYQQGPHPIDIISEKLVARKAAKKGKQLGLRYNYLLPHPSWLAKREQRRRESLLVGLGKRIIFDENGCMLDVFGNPVEAMKLVSTHDFNNNNNSVKEEEKENEEENYNNKLNQNVEKQTQETNNIIKPHPFNASPINSVSMITSTALVDPTKACTSLVRTVVRDRKVADAIKKANITTSYISSSLVMGPSIGLEETNTIGSNGAYNNNNNNNNNNLVNSSGMGSRGVQKANLPIRKPKVPEKRSRMASFEP